MRLSKRVNVIFQSMPHREFYPYSLCGLYLGHDMRSILTPDHILDNLAVSNMALTKSVNMRFFLSITPFDWAEEGGSLMYNTMFYTQ
jgi:hypothetical protein